jgi:hypothetical protein
MRTYTFLLILKVVIPPTQEHSVSASQAGLITQLNAAIGDSK